MKSKTASKVTTKKSTISARKQLLNMNALADVMEVKDLKNFLGIGINQAYALCHSDAFHVAKIGKKRYLIAKLTFLSWFLGVTLTHKTLSEIQDHVDNLCKSTMIQPEFA